MSIYTTLLEVYLSITTFTGWYRKLRYYHGGAYDLALIVVDLHLEQSSLDSTSFSIQYS